VIEAASGGDWIVVPADLNPLAGSADVVVPASAQCGPLTLRCAFARTVAESTLASATRSGALPTNFLSQAQRRHRDIAGGKLRPTLLQEEREQESEYQEWLRTTLAPTAAALGSPAQLAPKNLVDARDARRQSFLAGRNWRVAAALLLTAGLSAALVFQWKEAEVAAERAAHLAAEQQHQNDLDNLQQELLQQTEAARRDRAALEEALATHSAPPPPTLPEVQSPDAIVNPQLIWFQPKPDAERSAAEVVTLAPAAQWLTFVLETRNPRTFPRYRASLFKENGTKIWASDALHVQGVSEIVLSLPATLVPPGRYRFQLEGLRDARSEPLEEFRFRAVRAGDEGR